MKGEDTDRYTQIVFWVLLVLYMWLSLVTIPSHMFELIWFEKSNSSNSMSQPSLTKSLLAQQVAQERDLWPIHTSCPASILGLAPFLFSTPSRISYRGASSTSWRNGMFYCVCYTWSTSLPSVFISILFWDGPCKHHIFLWKISHTCCEVSFWQDLPTSYLTVLPNILPDSFQPKTDWVFW